MIRRAWLAMVPLLLIGTSCATAVEWNPVGIDAGHGSALKSAGGAVTGAAGADAMGGMPIDPGSGGTPVAAGGSPPGNGGSSAGGGGRRGGGTGGRTGGVGTGSCNLTSCPVCNVVQGPACCTPAGQCGCPLFWIPGTCG